MVEVGAFSSVMQVLLRLLLVLFGVSDQIKKFCAAKRGEVCYTVAKVNSETIA